MPVVGGAWIIGYKAWGSLLARRLSRYGVIVCCLDYRNFPQVAAPLKSRVLADCRQTIQTPMGIMLMC